MENIRPFSHRKTSQKVLDILTAGDISQSKIIDVGSGEGYFAGLLGAYLKKRYAIDPAAVLKACDLFPEQFKYREVPCDRIDANGVLPYDENSFDVAVCIEVIEHIENQFHLIKELFRIVKPGGRVIVTTPNILNINSRWRFLHSGFGLLFSPLSLDSNDPIRLGGHIHPISFYYLAYIFHRCRFRQIKVYFDRKKKSGIFWTLLLYPLIWAGNLFFRLRIRRKNKNIYKENDELLRKINSLNMLVSRTVIVEGVK